MFLKSPTHRLGSERNSCPSIIHVSHGWAAGPHTELGSSTVKPGRSHCTGLFYREARQIRGQRKELRTPYKQPLYVVCVGRSPRACTCGCGWLRVPPSPPAASDHTSFLLVCLQAGFRKGRGTRDQIANIRWIIESARELTNT